MRSFALKFKVLVDAAVSALEEVEHVIVVMHRVYHRDHIDIVKQSAVQKFDLAGVEVDLSLLDQLRAELQIDGLLCRNTDKADRAAKSVQRARLRQRSGAAQNCGGLAVVAAGVNRVRPLIRLRMRRAHERIQLADQRQLRAGTASIQIRDKARDALRRFDLKAHFFILANEIFCRLPLLVADLRVLPQIALRVQDQLLVLVYKLCILFILLLHCVFLLQAYSSYRWHMTWCPPPTSFFSGHCSAQIGFAYGYLVRNTQPDGGESGDGSSP